MFNVILYEPEIPPNTGNIIRLCANAGALLHLIEPLGFAMSDRELKRAGLDYHEYTAVRTHSNLESCLAVVAAPTVHAFSTRGGVTLDDARFSAGGALLFGPETRGLPATVLDSMDAQFIVRLPMRPTSRSLNLSNAVAIALYTAWRQHAYAGAALTRQP